MGQDLARAFAAARAVFEEADDALSEPLGRLILSGPEETLETHLMVFAAERARHERRVVDVEV